MRKVLPGDTELSSLAADGAALVRLHAIAARLLGDEPLPDLLDALLEAAIEVAGAPKGTVRLADDADGPLRCVAHRGLDTPFLEYLRAHVHGRRTCQAMARGGDEVVIEDLAVHPMVDAPTRAVFREAGISAVFAMALRARDGRFLGALSVYWPQPHQPGRVVRHALEILAWQVAALLDHEAREAELQRTAAIGRHMMEQLRDQMLVVEALPDPDGEVVDWTVVDCNDAVLDDEQVSRELLLGERLSVFAPDRWAELHERFCGVLATGRTNRFEVSWRGRTFDVRAFRIDARTVGVGAQDVTDHKRALDAAHRAVRTHHWRQKQLAWEAALTEVRERRRLAVELHDGVGQSLVLAKMKLDDTRRDLPEENRAGVDAARELLSLAIEGTRTLTNDLSPPGLFDLGLSEALRWLARKLAERHGLSVVVAGEVAADALPEAHAAVLFRCARELLINVVKHARVRTARVAVVRGDEAIAVSVEDAGVGFEPRNNRLHRHSFGLFSVSEQVASLGGTVEIRAAPRLGARITLRLPLSGAAVPETEAP